MANGRSAALALRETRTLFGMGGVASLSDEQLLRRFANRDPHADDAAEMAFRALIQRHGPMVLGVCRRILSDTHAAEDAFQATFLVLVRKSHSVLVADSLAPWLHGVTRRVACRVKSREARRRIHERPIVGSLTSSVTDGVDRADLRTVIEAELRQLPECFRTPVLLCDLEGLSHEEAASRLGCPLGTIKSRLTRGRLRLRDRLVRRGITTAQEASAWLPPALLESTARAALAYAAKPRIAGTIAAGVESLVRATLRTLFLSRLKVTAVWLVFTSAILGGLPFLQAEDPGRAQVSSPIARPNEVNAKATFALSAERLLTVKALDDDTGKPAPDIALKVLGEQHAKSIVVEAKTGADGIATLTLPTGRYHQLIAQPPDTSNYITVHFDALMIFKEPNPKPLEIRLKRGSEILIEVIEARTKEPVRGLFFWIASANKPQEWHYLGDWSNDGPPQATRKDGKLRAVLHLPDAGTYRIKIGGLIDQDPLRPKNWVAPFFPGSMYHPLKPETGPIALPTDKKVTLKFQVYRLIGPGFFDPSREIKNRR